MKYLFALALIAGCLTQPSVPARGQEEAPLTVIFAGRLIDSEEGSVIESRMIVIRDGTIVSVGGIESPPNGAGLIDLSDMTVMPGFIDAHTHLVGSSDDPDPTSILRYTAAERAFQSVPNAKIVLESGFTTVRDLGPYRALIDVAMRDAIERGDFPGPRMRVAGALVTITGGAGSIAGYAPDIILPWDLKYGQANTPDEVRERVRALASQRVDVIKVMATGAVLTHNSNPQAREFSFNEISAAVEEARNFGLGVAAHAHNAEGIKNAIRAGVVSIEHGTYLDAEGRALMKEHGVYLVPTLSVQDCIGLENDFPTEFVNRAQDVMASARRTFREAVEDGVKVALGSDVGVCSPGTNAREFDWMVRHGMTPMQAIQAATRNGADLLGLGNRIGRIEPGMLADIVGVRGDPLEDVRLLEDVQFVMKEGTVYKFRQ